MQNGTLGVGLEDNSSISMLPASGSLVIRATWHTHDEVLKLLRSIRKANQENQPVDRRESNALPFKFPSRDEVLQAMPTRFACADRGLVQCELLNYQVSPARYYPLVGQASVGSAHFRCTVTSDGKEHVLYLDRSHLIPVMPAAEKCTLPI